MFKGSDPINMDTKGRMAIPTRYRALLDEICPWRLGYYYRYEVYLPNALTASRMEKI